MRQEPCPRLQLLRPEEGLPDSVASPAQAGSRFVGRGGNWGFPETNLRYRGREYDIAVCYHREMNFTMIRNWVGQTGDEEFYGACDRHGIVVWQDFWLANPLDGPNPADNDLFPCNVQDFVWQTYDYYLDPTAAYFGSKKGSEPLHIQWNPVADNGEAVNYSAGNTTGLTARMELLNMDGTRNPEKRNAFQKTR